MTTDTVLVTSVTDANQEIDDVSMDIPNEFSKTKMPQGNARIIMKIRGVLEDILLEIDPKNTSTFQSEKAAMKFCVRAC